jgi:hypothetical protein
MWKDMPSYVFVTAFIFLFLHTAPVFEVILPLGDVPQPTPLVPSHVLGPTPIEPLLAVTAEDCRWFAARCFGYDAALLWSVHSGRQWQNGCGGRGVDN